MPVIVINENYLLTEQGRGEAGCSFKDGFPVLNLCYMTHKLRGLSVYLRVCFVASTMRLFRSILIHLSLVSLANSFLSRTAHV